VLTKDVGVTSMAIRFGEHMHHDVEQLDLRLRPPSDVAGGIDGQLCDRGITVLPGTPVSLDDVSAGLVRRTQSESAQPGPN
jgi:hypothetical protein